MSEYGFTKKDWVLFREKIADWQEAYRSKREYNPAAQGGIRDSVPAQIRRDSWRGFRM